MKVWVAGCTVMFMMAVAVALIGKRHLGPLGGLAVGLLMVILLLGAQVVFNWQSRAVLFARTNDEYIEALRQIGKLEEREFRATRAFQVEEFEDEGLHYFVELEDRSVLYLAGQYLYFYEEHDAEDDEPAQPRRFPCTRFTVRTNLNGGYTEGLLCEGEVLEPEVTAPPFSREDYRGGRVPKDRTIIRDRTYEELKAERLEALNR